jgi:hypothetical protein
LATIENMSIPALSLPSDAAIAATDIDNVDVALSENIFVLPEKFYFFLSEIMLWMRILSRQDGAYARSSRYAGRGCGGRESSQRG